MSRKMPYSQVVLAFCILMAAVFAALFFTFSRVYSAQRAQAEMGDTIVTLSRVSRLADKLSASPADPSLRQEMDGELARLQSGRMTDRAGYRNLLQAAQGVIGLSLLLCVAFAWVFYFFLLLRILRPFQRMEAFAAGVAAGDLDSPLRMERGNVFGAFSWAFDLMRTELKRAKAAEEEARLAQKTLIATISHDIKTPVASIRAYAEALSGGLAAAPARRQKYLAVILRKADEVTALTNDLFLHALSDIDRLTIEPESLPASAALGEILETVRMQYGEKVRILTGVPDVCIRTDRRRLAQVFENLIANAVKYAPDSVLHLRFSEENGFLTCAFEDFGGGIPPGDLPFVQEKFYRGKNAGRQKGAGLGLYIVRYIMQKTGGFLTLQNTGRGLLAVIGIKIDGA